MNFLGIEISREARASDLDATDDRWYQSIFQAFPRSAAGAAVTPDSAIRLSAVYCAVKIISETIASLPLEIFERTGERTRDQAIGHPLCTLLGLFPNRWQTRFEFIEQMTLHLLLRGNAYAQIVMTGEGQISQLIPLDPDRMTVKPTPRNKLEFEYRKADGTTRIFKWWQILHLKAFSLDGITGLSVIELCRDPIGLTAAAEEYSSRFYNNDATPGGVLEYPGKLDDKAHARLKSSWQDVHQGSSNSHRIGILEEGMTWKPISVSARDAQFLEARQFQVEEIARIFNIPPHMLKDLRHATFSNIESQDLSFMKHTIRPWLERWELVIQRDIVARVNDEFLEGTNHPKFFVQFDVKSITKADFKTRNESYAIGITHGWYSPNDIRNFENLNPVEGGDIYLAPLNMIPLEMLPDFPFGGQAAPPGDEPDDKKKDKDKDKDKKKDKDEDRFFKQSRESFKRIFTEMIGRLVRREEKEIDRILRQGKSLESWSQRFYKKHGTLIEESLLEASIAYIEQLSLTEHLSGHSGRSAKEAAECALDLFIKDYIKRVRDEIKREGESIGTNWAARPMIEAESLLNDIEHQLNGGNGHA